MDVEGTHPEAFPASVNTKSKPRPMENKKPLEPNDSKGFAVPPQGFEPWTR